VLRRFSGIIAGKAGIGRILSLSSLLVVVGLASLLLIPSPRRAAEARGEPGDFDYYVLVLSWSPTHCLVSRDRGRSDSQQCSGERPYSFVLHGLWPQWHRGWPEFCRTRERPWVPNSLINEMLDIMPGKGLVIHQYRKHGTCSGMSPEQYFSVARQLFESVKIPERFRRPDAEQKVTPQEVAAAFLDANPQFKPGMIAVSCERDLVEEVRICFGRDRKPTECGQNENQERVCRRDKLTLPPVRWRPSGI
jgi:ribonuclease T2